MAQNTNPAVDPNATGGQSSIVGSGSTTADVTPAWGEALPPWADWLISMIVSGQSWPQGSETRLWALAKEHQALGGGLYGSVERNVAGYRAVLVGWEVPATPVYLREAGRLLESGVGGLGVENLNKALQADSFASETQYSKLSINVAFWIAVIAAFIALVVAFFTAGTTAPVIGPIAASARAAIARILQRLAMVAGRDFSAGVATRLAATNAGRVGAQGLFRTVLTSHLGREIIEEIGEEVFIDAWTQRRQMELGTRTNWDWNRTKASAVGAGGGAVIGMKFAAPLSRFSDRVPLLRTLNNAGGTAPGVGNAFLRFPGRALQTGLNNMVASPAGSILANAAVYHEWHPITGESLLGAMMGGAGRTNTISPFNPDVAAAVTHPIATLHSAEAAAARSDAARADLANTTGPEPPPADPNPNPDPDPDPDSSRQDPAAPHTAPAGVGGGLPLSGNPSADGDPAAATNPPASATSSPPSPGGPPAAGSPTGQPLATASPNLSGQPPATGTDQPTSAGQPPATGSPTGQPPATGSPNLSGQPPATGTDQPTSAGQPPASSEATGAKTSPASPTGTASPGAPASPSTGDPSNGGVAPAPSGAPSGAAPASPQGTPSGPPAPAGTPTGDPQATGSGAPAGSAPQTANPATPATPPGSGPVAPAVPGQNAAPQAGTPVTGTPVTGPQGDPGSAATPGTTPGTSPSTPSSPTPPAMAMGSTPSGPDAALAPPSAGTSSTAMAGPGTAPAEASEVVPAFSTPRPPAPEPTSRRKADDPDVVREVADVVSRTLPIVAPDALPLQDGTLRFTAPNGRVYRVPADVLDRTLSHLRRRVADGAHGDQVVAEAAAWLGKAMARAGHRVSPMEGALNALGRLADASPDLRGVAIDVARDYVGRRWHRVRLGRLEHPGDRLAKQAMRRPGLQPIAQLYNVRTEVLERARQQIAERVAALESHLGGDPDTSQADPGHDATRPAQGVIRRFLGDPAGRARLRADAEARFEEFRRLARLWTEAAPDERSAHRTSLDQLATRMEAQGDTVPVPPWDTDRVRTVPGVPATPALPTPAPAATPATSTPGAAGPEPEARPVPAAVTELSEQVRRLRDSLVEASAAIHRLRIANSRKRMDLEDTSEITEGKIDKARHGEDRWAEERGRKLRADLSDQRASIERHRRIGERYRQAEDLAAAVISAYKDVAGALDAWAAAEQTTESAAQMAARVARLSEQADAAFAEYAAAMAKARPQQELLAAGIAASELPHMMELTEEVNRQLAGRGASQRFTAEELHWELGSRFDQLATGDGVVLRVGVGNKQVELRIQGTLGEPVEVPDARRKHSEGMSARLTQGGSWVSATIARLVNITSDWNTMVLARLLPDDSPPDTLWGRIQAWAKYVVLGVGYNRGHATNISVSSAGYVLDGQVADNRGDGTMFLVPMTYNVSTRHHSELEWSQEVLVGDEEGQPLRLWLSHAHTEPPPEETFQLRPDEVGEAPFPRYVSLHTTGLESLADELISELGYPYGKVGNRARDQIRTILTEELVSQFHTALVPPANGAPGTSARPSEFFKPIYDGGHPVGVLEVRSTPRPNPRLLTRVALKQMMEFLGVVFSGSNGAMSSSRFSGVGVRAGAGFDADTSDGAHGLAAMSKRLVASLQRAWSRTDGLSTGGVAIQPLVRRLAHTNAHEVIMDHTVVFHSFDGPGAEVEGVTTSVLQTPVRDAARYGWEVDADALVKDDDGNPRRRPDDSYIFHGETVPERPPGRRFADEPEIRIPDFMGTGPDQIRGPGPTVVYLNAAQVEKYRNQVEAELRKLQLLPEQDADGRLRWSADPLRREAQVANLREVRQQFTVNAVQSRLDQACQEGFLFDVIDVGQMQRLEQHSVRVRLRDTGAWSYAGWGTGDPFVGLNIASNTTVRSRTRSRTWGAGLALTLLRTLTQKVFGLFGKIGITPGILGGRGKSAGWGMGHTLNSVTLHESTTPLAEFTGGYFMDVELLQQGGHPKKLITGDLTSEPVAAQMFAATDLLPGGEPLPAEPHATPIELMRRSTLIHMETGSILSDIVGLLPSELGPGSAFYHQLAELVSVRALISNPAWMYAPYSIRVGDYEITIQGELGESTWERVRAPVNGEIILGLNSTSVNLGRQHNVGGSGSAGTTAQEEEPGQQEDTDLGEIDGRGSVSRFGGQSESQTRIEGDEPILVETGLALQSMAKLTFHVTVGKIGSDDVTRVSVPDLNLLYETPERDVLRLYGDRQLDVPMQAVADAVERYTNRDLQLMAPFARKLIRHYRQDLQRFRQARASEGHPRTPTDHLIDKHTDEILSAALAHQTRFDGRSLDEVLSPDLDEQKRLVDVPGHMVDGMGLSVFESVDLYDSDGVRTQPLDEVMQAIEKLAPGALKADGLVRRAIFGELAGENWWGKIRNLLSRQGKGWEFPIRVNGHRTEMIRITGRVRFGKEIVLEGRTDDLTILQQVYNYLEETWSAYKGWSVVRGVFGKLFGSGFGVGPSADTERSHTRSQSRTKQRTRLNRTGTFEGADRIRHDITFEIDVERMPLPDGWPGNRITRPLRTGARAAMRGLARAARVVDHKIASTQTPVPAPEPRYQAHPTIVLTGTARRLVPDGMTTDAGRQRQRPVPQLDPRSASVPEGFYADVRADDVADQVFERLAAEDALGATAEEARWVVYEGLSRMALTSRLRDMTDDNGYEMVSFPVPGTTDEVIRIWVEANLSDTDYAVGQSEADEEVGDVRRDQAAYNTAAERTKLTPVTLGVAGSENVTGIGAGVTVRDQASARASTSGGLRRETSLFLKEKGLTAEFAGRFTVRIERHKIRLGRGTRRLKSYPLAGPVAGAVYMRVLAPDYALLQAELETPPVSDTGWSFHEADGHGRTWHRIPGRRASRSTPLPLQEILDAANVDMASITADTVRAVAEKLRERLGPRSTGGPVALAAQADVFAEPLPPHWARLIARELGRGVELEVERTDAGDPTGRVDRYVVTRGGRLSSLVSDGGFTAALGALPPELLLTAAERQVDLRLLFNEVAVQGDFALVVRERFRALRIPVPVRPAPAFEPSKLWGPGPRREAGSTLGAIGMGGATAPVHAESGFVKGRAPEEGALEMDEIRAAVAEVNDSSVGSGRLSFVGTPGDPILRVVTATAPTPQHFRVTTGALADDRMARTDLRSGTVDDPHVMTLDSDVPSALVARTLVHELGHSLREFAAARQGPPQGIIRSSLPGADPATRPETNDHCLDARRDELRYLLDKAKRLPHLQSELEPQIDGLARFIAAQGRTPTAGRPSAPSIGALLNQDPATSAPASSLPSPPGPRPAVPVPAPRSPADPRSNPGDPARPRPSASRTSRAGSNPGRAPESDDEFWARMRRLTNSTGWIPPEDVVCVCAPGEPCTCGRRRGEDPSPAPSSPSPSVPTTPTTPADPGDPDDPDDPDDPREPTKPQEDDPRNRPVRVARGGTLWDIAKAWLGPGATESEIWRATLDWYNANRATIGNDPDLIRPGQVLRPPKLRPAQKGPR
ncbi:hypothetical protein GCM10022226_36090 [Sphaerisporangium flaviroseum]|uniref:Outer membrane channel protein CpnT-like N-terminal domain-containing protein n=1 Tax=Sphaerisporangium flaviroseum TaxID=509199 RepID=A0ABP7I8G9_9ACTN